MNIVIVFLLLIPSVLSGTSFEKRALELEGKIDSADEKLKAVDGKVDTLFSLLEDHIEKSVDVDVDQQTTTTQAPTASIPGPVTAILVTGGATGYGMSRDELDSAEVFLPDLNRTCRFPYLPDRDRYQHTLHTLNNTPVLCGGRLDEDLRLIRNCLQLIPTSASGVWSEYAEFMDGRTWRDGRGRESHTGWVSSDGLVLMGGAIRGRSTEIVPGGGYSFNLTQSHIESCAIPETDSVIITGGMGTDKMVVRYNLQGQVGDKLPDMNEDRRSHGCGSYEHTGNMVLLVFGGEQWDYSTLDSVEKMALGDSGWTKLDRLPNYLDLKETASVSLDNKVYFLGGDSYGGEIDGIYYFDGDTEQWVEAGRLHTARWGHAATVVYIQDTTALCKCD